MTNLFDIFIVGVITVSAWVGYNRGFAKEVVPMLSFIGAFFALIFGYQPVFDILQELIGSEAFASVATFTLLTGGVFALLRKAANRIGQDVAGTHDTHTDKTLGLVFGVLRGSLTMVLLFGVLSWLSNELKWSYTDAAGVAQPGKRWLNEARLRPSLQSGLDGVMVMLPDDLSSWLVAKNVPPEGEYTPDGKIGTESAAKPVNTDKKSQKTVAKSSDPAVKTANYQEDPLLKKKE